ncbi:MAG: DUF4397 domain-containing protein [Flavobacteriales bacterium]|nr:MAG: DUF4397 domain-containing protein [Flavobacteriales bacterium]
MKFINNLKTNTLIAIIGISLISLSSCKKDNVNNDPIEFGDAKLKVVNAVQGSASQDFYQGDTKLSTTPIAFGESSPYLTVKAGNSVISYRNTGTTTATATSSLGVYTNDSYTIFYVSSATGAGSIVGFPDDLVAPATGKAKLRFVNLGAALNNTINVSLAGGTALVTGLQYGRSTTYGVIDANTALTANVLGSATISIPGSTFQSGKIYTIWFDAASTTTINYHVVEQN